MDDMNEGELMPVVAEQSMVAMLNKSEIDQQITTAKKHPRSVVNFRKEALQMVTLNERVAESCIYALPRDGKTIEGPSARFAEVILSAWGNCRAGARVISDSGEFVTAQGVFHDLERNVAITYEVQRRITNKSGKRFGADMIGVTANAACSIALRNAALKGVPKAFWDDLYEAARQTIRGDFKTLSNRRAETLTKFQGYGMNKEQVCALLSIGGIEDIGLDELVTLRGVLTALREGETTPEQLAAQPDSTSKPKVSIPQPKKAEPEAPTDSPEPPSVTLESAGGIAFAEVPEKPKAGKGGKETSVGSPEGTPLASEGEKKFLLNKIAKANLTLESVMEEAGITNFEALTADGFIAMKEVLPK